MVGDDSSKKGVSSSSFDLNLTFGDPLYLYPNDTSSLPIVAIKLPGTENYKVWSIALTSALRNHDKIRFIDGTCKKDNTNPALSTQWDMCNFVVFTWILNSLIDGSVVFNLHKSISSLNQHGASLADYYNKLNSLWKQFDAMVSLPAYTCEAAGHFEKHNQLIKLMQFRMGLDDNYLAIRSNILTREPLPLVKAAFAIVSGEKSHRNITSSGATKPTATAFATKTFDKKVNVVDISNLGLTVGHPNGTQALITKIGDLKINNTITLYDVLVVFEYTISLLSHHKLLRDNKLLLDLMRVIAIFGI
nr:hypothetical protein [Tanacetum cinerariifolium]